MLGLYRDITPIMNYCSRIGLNRGYIGAMLGLYRDITPIMENQMEKKVQIEMETVGL